MAERRCDRFCSLSGAGEASPRQRAATVFIVDDDVSVRESLQWLIEGNGWEPQVFPSAEAFLARPRVLVPSCLILDVALPGLNGLELQHCIADRIGLPVIFITGHADVATAVRAIKAGAQEFLTKPFDVTVLLEAIRDSIDRSIASLDGARGLDSDSCAASAGSTAG